MSRNRKKSRKPEQKQSAALRQSEALSKAADRAVDAQTPGFVRWYQETEGNLGADAMEILESVKKFVWLYAANGGQTLATCFDPEIFFLSVDQMKAASDQDESKFFDYLMQDVQVYVAYLDHAGIWQGLPEDLEEIVSTFEIDDEDGEAAGSRPDAVTAAEDEESTEPTAAPGRWLASLLNWIGDGKSVTTTGALRLADIQDAAASVDVFAVGSQKKLTDEQFAVLARPDGTLPQMVRTMAEVTRLATVWGVAEDLGLISVTSKNVTVTEAGKSFDSSDAAQVAILQDRLNENAA